MRNDVEILRAACCVAGLDGGVCQDELNLLQQMASDIGVGKASLDAMVSRSEKDPNFYQELFKILTADAEGTMEILFRVAVVDSELNVNESVVLHDFARRLGVSEERYEEMLKKVDRSIGS